MPDYLLHISPGCRSVESVELRIHACSIEQKGHRPVRIVTLEELRNLIARSSLAEVEDEVTAALARGLKSEIVAREDDREIFDPLATLLQRAFQDLLATTAAYGAGCN